MTQHQVDEAYKAYQESVKAWDDAEEAHTAAVAVMYSKKAALEQCERRCDRLWKEYQRLLKAHQI